VRHDRMERMAPSSYCRALGWAGQMPRFQRMNRGTSTKPQRRPQTDWVSHQPISATFSTKMNRAMTRPERLR